MEHEILKVGLSKLNFNDNITEQLRNILLEIPNYVSTSYSPILAPLSVSIVYILLALTFGRCVRNFMNILPVDSAARLLLLEFFFSAEKCACVCELSVIAERYGIEAYIIVLFILLLWWSSTLIEPTACPYSYLEEVVKGNLGFIDLVVLTSAQLLGGLLVFQYVHFMWNLEVIKEHVDRAYRECTTDIQVIPIFAALIEAVGTCIYNLISKVLKKRRVKTENAIKSALTIGLSMTAYNYSGGYFNPMLATCTNFRCRGSTTFEHILVYWIGPCTGAIISVFLCRSDTEELIL